MGLATTPAAENRRLQKALDYAITVIENYEMDIRNSAWTGVDLVEQGFCQGSIYRTALEAIERIKDGTQEP